MSNLTVYCQLKHGFGYKVEEIKIKKGDMEISFTQEEWDIIKETADGNHGEAAVFENESDYLPEEIFRWYPKVNKKNIDKADSSSNVNVEEIKSKET